MFAGEGIGQGRVTDNLAPDIKLLDGAISIPDAKTIRMIYHLLQEDGLYLGASSALNVVAAKELALKLGKGSRVVTILCDGAYRFVLPLFFGDGCVGGLTGTFLHAGTRPGCSRASGSSRRSCSRRSRRSTSTSSPSPRVSSLHLEIPKDNLIIGLFGEARVGVYLSPP